MSVHVDEVFMSVKPGTLKVIKENIKENLKISESGKVKKFLGVYYEWVHDAKDMYAKMTIKKDVKNLVEGYKKYMGGNLRIQKTPRALGATLSKSELEEPDNINNYIPLVG